MTAAVKYTIICRDGLSFTTHDDCGRVVKWSSSNPGTAADRGKGIVFFDCEIAELTSNDETAAYEAVLFKIIGDSVPRAVALSLRTMRKSAERFTPKVFDGE